MLMARIENGTHALHSHSVGLNSVTWPPLSAREAGTCSLADRGFSDLPTLSATVSLSVEQNLDGPAQLIIMNCDLSMISFIHFAYTSVHYSMIGMA